MCPSADALSAFQSLYPFALDSFQSRACQALAQDRDVLVAAPTGAGKTVVGEFAVHLAVLGGGKCFYTTPIKALSNQKFADLVERYGAQTVGLLTGDVSVNSEAPVVVMTTEVLRNMLYAASPTLSGLASVVMDEVHYLADKERGPVWEEVIISLPPSVRLVSLSATVSNAEEFGDWLKTVRGPTDVVVEERRPVPLWQHVMVGSRLHDLFVDEAQERVNPELVRLARESAQAAKTGSRRPVRGGRRPQSRHLVPRRADVISRLERSAMLPAIVFVFSRAGCDAAVEQAVHSGVTLTQPSEVAQIDAVAAEAVRGLGPDDRAVLGYDAWVAALRRGVAAHHAGLLPSFKLAVETLFSRGLVKVVYATETLALGINMPAKSVVLERLVKWNGEQHADVTPGEYTQLTGRAGRRGIDVEGHGIVTWHPGLDPLALGGLASTRTYPLRSSFRPSYNMAVNLVHQVGRARARRLLESSFAQFQLDRATVGQAARRRRLEEAIDGYAEAMACDRGDFAEYAQLRRALSDAERAGARQRRATRSAQAQADIAAWRTGDVLDIPSGRSRGLAVVLEPARGADRRLAPVVLTESRQIRRLAPGDLRQTPVRVTSVEVPRGFDSAAPAARRQLVSAVRRAARAAGQHSSLAAAGPPGDGQRDEDEVARLRAELRAHDCHFCPDREEHARWAERLWSVQREHARLVAGLARRQASIATAFDKVCAVLDTLGYLEHDTVTPDGQRLRGLFGELDLLAAEALRLGLWDDVTPSELAACVSALTFQSRGGEGPAHVPGGRAGLALRAMIEEWSDLHDLESEHGVDYLREPDLGFARAAERWASGHSLAAVLLDADLTAGDFVRAMRQVLDLLDQVADAATDPVGATARRAAAAVRRGVVAYDLA
jgi:ATP-dependent RNA helicase HelY